MFICTRFRYGWDCSFKLGTLRLILEFAGKYFYTLELALPLPPAAEQRVAVNQTDRTDPTTLSTSHALLTRSRYFNTIYIHTQLRSTNKFIINHQFKLNKIKNLELKRQFYF